MVGGCRVITVIIGGLVFCAAARAGMMPVAPGIGELGVSQGTCAPVVLSSLDSFHPYAFPSMTDLSLLPLDLSPDSGGDIHPIGATQPLRIVSDGQSSLALCLYALIGLGMFRSAPWVKKLSVGVLPDWYHSGGPGQIRHSLAISPDCCPVPICCLVQPHHTREGSPSRYGQGIAVSFWRNSQCTPTVVAARGPPYAS